MNHDTGKKQPFGWTRRAATGMRSFVQRVFFHVIALAFSALAALYADPIAGVTPSALVNFLAIYAGIACIAASGAAKSPVWVIPAVSGLFQSLILCFSVPLPQALFWGGAQAWLQRTLIRKMGMGSEWLWLLIFIPLAFELLPVTPTAMLGATFLGILLAGQFAWRLQQQRTIRIRAAEANKPISPADALAASVRDLRAKRVLLPADMRGSIAAIADHAERLLAIAPQDDPGGHAERFVKRYLPAVHQLVDKHCGMAAEEPASPELVRALAQSRDMANRLEAVFQKELLSVADNRAASFSAELKVLDTLLNMDGR